MADGKDSKSSKAQKPATTQGNIHVGGNVADSVVIIGDHNVINKYYQIIEKNTTKQEPDYWNLKHPYPMPPNFTGRVAERAMLTQWLNDDSENHLFILRALGGFGKSALSWQWLTHDVDPIQWPKVIFWSFYEGDASFENFTREVLEYLGIEVPQGGRRQVDELLKAMQSQKILLIMDGFERALRAYSSMNAAYQGDEESKLKDYQLDCVNINAEWFLKGACLNLKIKSKVLMTTRLTPRAIKPRGEFALGCREEELTAMQKADAVEFFHKQKIKGTHAEIEAACAPYGYHPLSLRLLAGRILKDFDNPADIVVAQKLKIDGDLKQHQHHVLEVSYNSLPPHEQKLLSTIACFRSPVEHKTLESIVENQSTLDNDLHDLVERSLLHFDEKNKRFDSHPLVRRYVYFQVSDSDRKKIHMKLVIFFVDELPVTNRKIITIGDLAPIIELYYHMVKSGQLDLAIDIYYRRLAKPLYFQFCIYLTIIELLRELFLDEENTLPQLKKSSNQAWVLNELGNSYSNSGQIYQSINMFKIAITLTDYKRDIARSVGNLATDQLDVGALGEANHNFRYRINLCREAQAKYDEGIGHTELGRFLSYVGLWDEARDEFQLAMELFEKIREIQYIGIVWAYRALHFMLMSRLDLLQKPEMLKSAIECARHSLKAAEETSQKEFHAERDFMHAHWLLGAAYCFDGQLDPAEHHLSEGLTNNRTINAVEFEANILLDLARLRYKQKHYAEAKSLVEEALTITERCGYVLQGADVNLFLAQYALEQEKDKVKAKAYAESALKLATCDGPPYYYKVAYEEAEKMLASLS